MTALTCCTINRWFLAIVVAIALASAISWSGGTIRETSPHRSAVSAFIGDDVREASRALLAPINRGSFCERPQDGKMPNLGEKSGSKIFQHLQVVGKKSATF